MTIRVLWKQPCSYVFLMLLCVTSICLAEAPEWETLKAGVYLSSEQGADGGNPEEDYNGGIWRLDPIDGFFKRVRQFYTSDDYEVYYFRGDDGRFAAVGDRLVYETWPADFRFDAFSWRMLNRVPAPNPEGSIGWALQGPILAAEDLGDTGLSPGKYGFAECVLDDVSAVHLWGPRLCDPLSLPGGFGDVTSSENDLLYFSGDDPSLLDSMEFVSTLPEVDLYEAHLLSFDGAKGGFWRGCDDGISFFPVVAGVFNEASFHLDFDPEFIDSDSRLQALHWNEASQRFLLSVFHWSSHGLDQRRLLSFDPLSGLWKEFVLPRSSGPFALDFSVVSMTSFRSPPKRYEQLIPIIARTSGAGGTDWSTDLWLFNPSDEAMQLKLSRISHPETVVDLELGPHQSLHREDLLSWLGGGPEGDGARHDALRISSEYRWGKQLSAYGRIWTPDPSGGGSYGQAIPAVPYPLGYSNHGIFLREDPEIYQVSTPGVAIAHFDLDLREERRYRYNLGFVNSSDEEIEIEILWGYNDANYNDYAFKHPDGWRKSVAIPAHSVKIVAADDLFPVESRPNWPPRLGILGSEPLPVWMSMVDEKTGDATFMPYSNFSYFSRYYDPYYGEWPDGPFFRLALPVAARTSGRNGSRWQTDLFGYGSSNDFGDEPSPYFYPADPATQCGGGASGSYAHLIRGEMGMGQDEWMEEILSSGMFGGVYGWRTIFPDIIHYFPECDGEESIYGGLELMTGSWFSGFSRTYTTREDGGTYGSMLPLYPPHGWPVQHFAGIEIGEESRVNVGFYNGDHEHDISHRIFLYSADGELFAETEFVLESTASKLLPIETLLGTGIPPGTYGMTVLPRDGVDDEGEAYEGHSWAYVSVVDNRTNDPINLW